MVCILQAAIKKELMPLTGCHGRGLDTPIPTTTHKTGILVSKSFGQENIYRQMFPVTILALLFCSTLGMIGEYFQYPWRALTSPGEPAHP